MKYGFFLLLLLLTTILFTCGYIFEDNLLRGAEGNWWDSDWLYRRMLTFDNSAQSEGLVNFPVLVRLTSANIDYNSTQDSGEDIRFIDTDETELSYEIEEWDESGESIVWVKVPVIDGSSNTDYIWMYYGNDSAPAGEDSAGVWSNGYIGVWHLDETGTGTRYDSTNASNGTTFGNVGESKVTGKMGAADTFDGAGDYIDTNQDYDLSGNGAFSVFTWVKDIPNADRYVICQAHILAPYSSDWILGYETNGLWFRSDSISGDDQLNDGSWHYFGFIFDGTDAKLYIDGSQYGGSITPIGYGAAVGATVKLMTNGNASSVFVSGLMDEVRISNTARSDDWIAAQYASMSDTFITFSAQE